MTCIYNCANALITHAGIKNSTNETVAYLKLQQYEFDTFQVYNLK